MRNYEVTIIVDPVLSDEMIKGAVKDIKELLTNEECSITATDEMGLRQLAYTINKRNSGVYYSIEFGSPNGSIIDRLELALRRDERIMRFLTVALDKFGVDYNDRKRKGLIGKKKETESAEGSKGPHKQEEE